VVGPERRARSQGGSVPSSGKNFVRRKILGRDSFRRMSSRRRLDHVGLYAATIGVALVGVAGLTHTRRALSGTFDEGNHLAAGLEWWQFGSYTLWTENPPLARLAVAALPYFSGMRLPPSAAWEPKTHDWDISWEMGTNLLYSGGGFERNLSRARLGTLPFF
jgi:hypothetical protein